jgi:hypothetical protein
VCFKLDLPKILVLLGFCEEKGEICLERENDLFKYVFLCVCVCVCREKERNGVERYEQETCWMSIMGVFCLEIIDC